MSKKTPLSNGLFTWPSEKPQLIGSRCKGCGEHFFPVQKGCSNCSSIDLSTVELGNQGTLWTWTIQGFMPKSPYNSDETPRTFTPFGVGYIEMPSGVKVEARLKENTPESLSIGMQMELVIEPLRTDEQGNQVINFAFQAMK